MLESRKKFSCSRI